MTISIKPAGVCCKEMSVDITDQGIITGASFKGGCAGNLEAVARLIKGMHYEIVESILKDIVCPGKKTSCSAEFVKGICEYMRGCK